MTPEEFFAQPEVDTALGTLKSIGLTRPDQIDATKAIFAAMIDLMNEIGSEVVLTSENFFALPAVNTALGDLRTNSRTRQQHVDSLEELLTALIDTANTLGADPTLDAEDFLATPEVDAELNNFRTAKDRSRREDIEGFKIILGEMVDLVNTLSFGPAMITNLQKLSLPLATALGTQVTLSDSFSLTSVNGPSGTIVLDDMDGLYVPNGVQNGKPKYIQAILGSNGVSTVAWDGTKWIVTGADSRIENYTSSEDVAYPWLVETWVDATLTGDLPVFMYPAVQELIAPSTAQFGVFVTAYNDSLNGVYQDTTYWTGLVNGKKVFHLMGVAGYGDDGVNAIIWVPNCEAMFSFGPSTPAWVLCDGGPTPVYYSLSNVASPDLATNWKVAEDNADADTVVINVTKGEMSAGLLITDDSAGDNGVYKANDTTNSRRAYRPLVATSGDDLSWYSASPAWTNGNGVFTLDNVPFPWLGEDSGADHAGYSMSRDDIAAEESWQAV
jgi:hypothetical protein